MSFRVIASALIGLSAPIAAMAGDLSVPVAQAAPIVAPTRTASPDLIFTLGGGAAVAPDYFGSEDYSVGPDFSFALKYLRLPGGYSFGSADDLNPRYGVALRGSFRFVDDRDSDDHAELAGLDDIDTSAELGLGLGYSSRNFDAFADLRYGVVGHESLVGEVGADLKMQPTDRLTLSAGPRVFLGSDDFADTYFGIGMDEATASGLPAYDAGGGVLSAGLELGARYEVNERWGIEGAVTWDRLTGEADDSPIVQQGDRDQYGLRIGVTRLITLDF